MRRGPTAELGAVVLIVLLSVAGSSAETGGSPPAMSGVVPAEPTGVPSVTVDHHPLPGAGPIVPGSPVRRSTMAVTARCFARCPGTEPSALRPTGLRATSNWTRLNTTIAPFARSGADLVYDARDGEDLLFGGTNATGGFLNDTWTFSNRTWTELHPATSPSPRSGASMTYDSGTGAVLLFGGEDATGYLNDTWSFSAGNWTELSPRSGIAPSPRYGASFAYDPLDNYSVLFGGFPSSPSIFGDSNQTWIFRNDSWTDLTPQLTREPVDRYDGAMAWDPALDAAVLFGGLSCPPGYCDFYGFTVLSDTWWFAHGNWSEADLPLEGPFSLAEAGAYDSSNGYLASLAWDGSTYELVGPDWVNTSIASGPAARTAYALADDPADHGVLLFGGSSSSTQTALNDTWELTGGPAAVPLELQLEGTLSVDLGESFHWYANVAGGSGGYVYNWSGLPPGCSTVDSVAVTCAPSATGPYTVEVTVTDRGGNRTLSVLAVNVYPSLSVVLSVAPGTIDLGQNVSLLATGKGGTGDYWVGWSGLPAGCTSTFGFTDPCRPNATGSFGVTFVLGDNTGAAVRSNGVVIVVNLPLRISGVTAVASSSPSPLTETFVAEVAGGTSPLSFEWRFGDGSYLTTSFSDAGHTYSSPGTYTVRITVTDAAGAAANWSLPVDVLAGAPPPLYVTAVATPVTLTIGTPLRMEANVMGGEAPYAFTWQGLPGGCVGTNSLRIACTPNASGVFPVRVTVQDAAGSRANASTPVTIAPGPTAVLSEVTLTNCSATFSAFYTVDVVGGTAPYAFVWAFGDGTTLAAGPAALHSYPRAGPHTWAVNVTLTDASGARTTATVLLTAPPAECPALGPTFPTNLTGAGGTTPSFPSWGFAVLAALGLTAAVAWAGVGIVLSRRDRTDTIDPPGPIRRPPGRR